MILTAQRYSLVFITKAIWSTYVLLSPPLGTTTAGTSGAGGRQDLPTVTAAILLSIGIKNSYAGSA